MAVFNFGIGSGLRATSLEILLKGVGIQALKTKVFRPAQGISVDRNDQFQDFEFVEEGFEQTSYLGTPIFDPVTIKGGRFFELSDIESSNEIDYDGLIIPAAIIEITQSKNIITTAIQGRNGTVKEFISDGDFTITITGVIIGENEGIAGTRDARVKDIGNIYPEKDVKKLITICKVPNSIEIISDFLSFFTDSNGQNTRYVITDYNLPQREGSRDAQLFQISMLTDTAIDLEELTIE